MKTTNSTFRKLVGTVAVVAATLLAPILSTAADTSKPLHLQNLATSETAHSLVWYPAESIATLEGKGFTDTPTTFSRLPSRARDEVTSMVWMLSGNTAGLALRFATDSTTIGAIWQGGQGMNHMARTGSNGLDLYEKTEGGWKFAGVGRPETTRSVSLLAKDRSTTQPTEYLLYLPLYERVPHLQLGLAPGAKVWPVPQREHKPIVFYGTSITQGGCASRAGMCHAAILGRWLDREVINLGFSGSGKSEPIMGKLLGEIDAALYVIEPLPNMTDEQVIERIPVLVRNIRQKRPEVPVILVENPLFRSESPRNLALRDALAQLQAEKVANLHLLPSHGQLDDLREDGTVDGVHPTDLGFLKMATAYEPLIRSLLKGD